MAKLFTRKIAAKHRKRILKDPLPCFRDWYHPWKIILAHRNKNPDLVNYKYLPILIYLFLALTSLSLLQAQTPAFPRRNPDPATPATSRPAANRETFGLEQGRAAQPNQRTTPDFNSNPAATNPSSPPSSQELRPSTENGNDVRSGVPNSGSSPDNSQKIEPSAPVPPYPNYPESTLPHPSRTPKQQEYLYFNHIYFEPLIIIGFVRFGWLGMISSGKALRLGIDLYVPSTSLDVIIAGQTENPDYQVLGFLMRLGIHFFAERTQLKGFEIGFDMRSGIVIAPASGNSILVQVGAELPITYRFVNNLYSSSGRPAVTLGFAPYLALGISAIISTSSTLTLLRSSDPGLEAYLTNGKYFFEPNHINELGPISLKLSVRFGFDVSLIL